MPVRVRYHLLLAFAGVARRSGRAARQVVNLAKRQADANQGIAIRLLTLLCARILVATADLALWLFARTLPRGDAERDG